ncbi:MAG: site-specific integrase, partial [Lachnospiraceae bacterium]|nr:site-specific integrase [Lachnospiraceae bacterium]
MEDERKVTEEEIKEYEEAMKEEEKAKNTIDKYRRDLKKLLNWLDGRSLTKSVATEWKNDLQDQYAASSVNSMLAAANGFFHWLGWVDLALAYLKIQRKVFCEKKKLLEKEDYDRLVAAAELLENL